MPSSREPERWTEPGSASASGGHLTPDPRAGSTAPDDLDRTARLEVPARERPRSDPTRAERASRATGTPPRRRVRGSIRRVRRTLKHIDPISALKLSLFFCACFMILWLIIVAIVYFILDAIGLFAAIEDFMRGFALGDEFNISLFDVERWAFLFGLVMGLFISLINVFLVFLYNAGADIVGGIEMTFVERDYRDG